MAEGLDELFGGAGRPRPRTRRVLVLLSVGAALSLFGLACSVVPGVMVLLLAWSAAAAEQDRIESGYLSPQDQPAVDRVRRAATVALLFAVALLFVQLSLLQRGFYTEMWKQALERVLATTS
jgi:hypothetical protein